VAAGQTIRNSALYCALTKIDDPNPPHRVEAFLYCPLHKAEQAAFVVDTSDVFERKLQVLRLHQSQFGKATEEFGVLPQSFGDYLFGLETRDRHYGSLVGVRFGEALITDRPV
jgi:LmbE family N-acetylglucosaminyl deacetylase